MESKVLLLTGEPGSGKTTVIRKVVELMGQRLDGFYTREIRRNGIRTGFEVVALSGERAVLASREPGASFAREARLADYRINLDAVESTAVPAVRRAMAAGKVALVDEIGPMQLLSPLFHAVVLDLLSSDIPALGTIVCRSHPIADRFRPHPRVTLVAVTSESRDALPEQLTSTLRDQNS